MNRSLRTFVAVEISPEVRTRAGQLIAQLQTNSAHVKWVEPSNLHFTMKFLGEIDLLDVHRVCGALTEAVQRLPPFEIVAQGAGAFPDPSRPRTIWLGVGEGEEAMVELHAALEAALTPLGFRRENRRFRPHLTLGRLRGPGEGIDELAAELAQHAEFVAGVVSVDDVVLFSSELQRTGPVYEALCTADLGGA